MARTPGADIILTLLSDVAELKENSVATTRHLEELEEDVASIATHLGGLVKISQDSGRRIERTAVTLSKLANLFKDHEARISALESRE